MLPETMEETEKAKDNLFLEYNKSDECLEVYNERKQCIMLATKELILEEIVFKFNMKGA